MENNPTENETSTTQTQNGETNTSTDAVNDTAKSFEEEYAASWGQPDPSAQQSSSDDEQAKTEDNKQERENEEEEPAESKFRAPIVDGRNISFPTKIVNQYLVCPLCMGYFKEAHTIIECLHTFCKSCIVKYFIYQKKSECPTCQTQLGPFPVDKLKYDRQIQNIVDKIFPHLEQEDVEVATQFYATRGLDVRELLTGPKRKGAQHQEPAPVVTKKLRKEDTQKKFYSDEVGFELVLDEKETSDKLKRLDKPFIRTSSRVTVKHLKKYLTNKIKMNPDDVVDLEITYRGEILGNEHTLEYVLKARGLEPGTKTPIFKYRLRSAEHSTLADSAI